MDECRRSPGKSQRRHRLNDDAGPQQGGRPGCAGAMPACRSCRARPVGRRRMSRTARLAAGPSAEQQRASCPANRAGCRNRSYRLPVALHHVMVPLAFRSNMLCQPSTPHAGSIVLGMRSAGSALYRELGEQAEPNQADGCDIGYAWACCKHARRPQACARQRARPVRAAWASSRSARKRVRGFRAEPRTRPRPLCQDPLSATDARRWRAWPRMRSGESQAGRCRSPASESGNEQPYTTDRSRSAGFGPTGPDACGQD